MVSITSDLKGLSKEREGGKQECVESMEKESGLETEGEREKKANVRTTTGVLISKSETDRA